MSEDNDTSDGLVSVNYKIMPEARQSLNDYAKTHGITLRVALTHILDCIGRDPSAIPAPTQYGVKFDLNTNGSLVTIATCDTCKDGYSPIDYGNSVEAFMSWLEEHKHGRKG